MNIKELQPRQGNIDLIASVSEMGEIRSFSKFGKSGRVASAKIKDDSGEVKLSLWNEQVDLIKQGDTIHLKEGWCDEWRGDLQVSTGRKGTIEVVKKGEGAPAKEEKVAEPKDEESFADEEDLF